MVRLSPWERAAALEKARIQGCSLSVLMRAALDAYVPRSPDGATGNAIRNETGEEPGQIRIEYED